MKMRNNNMGLKEEIKKILKENVGYLSDGDSISEDTERDRVAKLIIKIMIDKFY